MKKILIIEDDESICKELKELLENASFEATILKKFNNAPFVLDFLFGKFIYSFSIYFRTQ